MHAREKERERTDGSRATTTMTTATVTTIMTTMTTKTMMMTMEKFAQAHLPIRSAHARVCSRSHRRAWSRSRGSNDPVDGPHGSRPSTQRRADDDNDDSDDPFCLLCAEGRATRAGPAATRNTATKNARRDGTELDAERQGEAGRTERGRGLAHATRSMVCCQLA